MSCYQPLIRIENLNKWETAEDGHKYHPARIISSKDLENFDSAGILTYKYQQIPCGKCIGCRLDYSREWANRGYLEAQQYEHNWFVTLTYDEEHITIPEEIETKNGYTFTEPEGIEWIGTIVPKELTQFMKNLRQIMKREYNEEGIRFMACGEYGGEGKRPHYHLILFNINLPTETFYEPHINWQKQTSWKNTIIERAWAKKGITDITEATWETIAYTARYITKKINGEIADEYYGIQGQVPEFFRVSRNPGIAREYYEENKEQIYKADKILIKTRHGPTWVQPPKYFDTLYEKEFPEKMKKIKERRRKRNIDKLKIKGQTTSLTRWEQLQIEMATKEDTSKALKRGLEHERR